MVVLVEETRILLPATFTGSTSYCVAFVTAFQFKLMLFIVLVEVTFRVFESGTFTFTV